MEDTLNNFGQTLHQFFNKERLETIARQVKFVQRKSPLNGFTFLQVAVFGFIDDPQANLDDLAGYCQELGVEISAQGFDQRINPAAVEFLKK